MPNVSCVALGVPPPAPVEPDEPDEPPLPLPLSLALQPARAKRRKLGARTPMVVMKRFVFMGEVTPFLAAEYRNSESVRSVRGASDWREMIVDAPGGTTRDGRNEIEIAV
jgi:hypothetical protein